ncbi:unnamed protein product, partial [Discosporangium mesarthrocarpum]
MLPGGDRRGGGDLERNAGRKGHARGTPAVNHCWACRPAFLVVAGMTLLFSINLFRLAKEETAAMSEGDRGSVPPTDTVT